MTLGVDVCNEIILSLCTHYHLGVIIKEIHLISDNKYNTKYNTNQYWLLSTGTAVLSHCVYYTHSETVLHSQYQY